MKNVLSVLLAAAMVMGMSVSAFAANANNDEVGVHACDLGFKYWMEVIHSENNMNHGDKKIQWAWHEEAFEDMRLAPKNLSRCLEDSGTITSNFIPWNTCGATMSNFLKCPQWGAGGYAPYAILNWLNPLVSIFFGFAGITMTKMTDEEYERILEEREAEKAAALKALEA